MCSSDLAPAVISPTLLLVSGRDAVVRHEAQHRFYERLGAADKARIYVPGAFHDTLGERDRADSVAACRDFIARCFAGATARPCLLDADRHGFSRRVQDQISRPLAACSLRGMYWQLQRLLIRIGAHFSEGLRIGRETGFDSGGTLDYVYRNQPAGTNAFGLFVDRLFIRSLSKKARLFVRKSKRETSCTTSIRPMRFGFRGAIFYAVRGMNSTKCRIFAAGEANACTISPIGISKAMPASARARRELFTEKILST